MNLSSHDVIILCGGLGTRFRPVDPTIPKVMARVAGRPFLDWVIELFSRQGSQRCILCTSYKSDIIEAHVRKRHHSSLLEIIISREREPLGTGGAVKYAARHLQNQPFFVANGDSYCRVDLQQFAEFHHQHHARASVVLTRAGVRNDSGRVMLDERTHEIVSFKEKEGGSPSESAGIYCFARDIVDGMPSGQNISLEYDVFPALAGRGLYGYVVDSEVIDIGTPERYDTAHTSFSPL